jgi:hypothetical protein
MRSGRSHRSRWAAMPRPVCPPVGELQQDGRPDGYRIGRARRPQFFALARHLRALEQSGAISGYHAHLDSVLGDPDYLSSGSNRCSCGPLQLYAQAAEFGVDRLSDWRQSARSSRESRGACLHEAAILSCAKQPLTPSRSGISRYSPVIWMPYSKGTPT